MPVMNQTMTVYTDIKNKIINGVYSPAESLREIELANDYGVSRNTVKKVLLMLEKESLVVVEINKGAKVRAYSLDEVIALLQVRSVLEGFIVSLAIEKASEEHLSRLKKHLDEMEKCKDEHDLVNYSSRNKLFHEVIYDACPNKSAVELTLSLKNQLSKYNMKTILVPGRDEQSFNEHCRIYEAFKIRDAEIAKILMERHINNVLLTFKENYALLC